MTRAKAVERGHEAGCRSRRIGPQPGVEVLRAGVEQLHERRVLRHHPPELPELGGGFGRFDRAQPGRQPVDEAVTALRRHQALQHRPAHAGREPGADQLVHQPVEVLPVAVDDGQQRSVGRRRHGGRLRHGAVDETPDLGDPAVVRAQDPRGDEPHRAQRGPWAAVPGPAAARRRIREAEHLLVDVGRRQSGRPRGGRAGERDVGVEVPGEHPDDREGDAVELAELLRRGEAGVDREPALALRERLGHDRAGERAHDVGVDLAGVATTQQREALARRGARSGTTARRDRARSCRSRLGGHHPTRRHDGRTYAPGRQPMTGGRWV